MEYKGYKAKIIYEEDLNTFQGEVLGINDVITFYGNNPKELEREFKISVNEYLDFCAEMGKKPEKTYSGKLMLRIAPELHARLAEQAQKHGQSLNTFIENNINAAAFQ